MFSQNIAFAILFRPVYNYVLCVYVVTFFPLGNGDLGKLCYRLSGNPFLRHSVFNQCMHCTMPQYASQGS